MDRDALDARINRGIPLLTTFLTQGSSGIDETAFRSILGDDLSDDDVIAALSDMLLVARLVMMSYHVKTDIEPIDVLREIAVHREQKRNQ